MLSTFFGLTIAQSGLNAFHVALNTTANNISNVRTEGYSKQVANRVASSALRTYTPYGAVGTGVTTVSVTQLRNLYYDRRYWSNQSSLGMYETRLDYFQQIENYFDDDGKEGFSTILDKMFNYLDTLKTNAGDVNAREQFVGGARDLASYFNSVSNGLSDIQNSANEEIKSAVANINAIGEKIAMLNKQINVIELEGGYANELRDQRALLVDELSKIVPIEAEEVPVQNSNYPDQYLGGTYYTVKICGQLFVNTFDYNSLECVSRKNKINQTDIDGLYDIKWTHTGNRFYGGGNGMTGSLRALFDIRDGNNKENLSGVARVENGRTVRVESPSMNSIEKMSIPERGTLTINGRYYDYDGFTFEMDEETGKVTSYSFNLEDPLSEEEKKKVEGMGASVGTAIDSMGVPYYQAQMSQFLRSFCEMFNDILKTGEDLNGDTTDYYAFFAAENKMTGEEYTFNGEGGNSSSGSIYYKLTGANICVSSICRNPDKLGLVFHAKDAEGSEIESSGVDSYNLCEKLLKLKNDVKLYRGGNAADFLKCMIADISVDTQESKIFYENYYNIGDTIESMRMSVSGVDEDEEGLDLMKFQYSYNLASKMISVFAEIYDKLIQETGV